jgi:hypothetical protein
MSDRGSVIVNANVKGRASNGGGVLEEVAEEGPRDEDEIVLNDTSYNQNPFDDDDDEDQEEVKEEVQEEEVKEEVIEEEDNFGRDGSDVTIIQNSTAATAEKGDTSV